MPSADEISVKCIYVGLYSRDKTRKRKRWVDCTIHVDHFQDFSKKVKCEVYDDDTKRLVTHSFVRFPQASTYVIPCEFEFHTEKYVVQFQEAQSENLPPEKGVNALGPHPETVTAPIQKVNINRGPKRKRQEASAHRLWTFRGMVRSKIEVRALLESIVDGTLPDKSGATELALNGGTCIVQNENAIVANPNFESAASISNRFQVPRVREAGKDCMKRQREPLSHDFRSTSGTLSDFSFIRFLTHPSEIVNHSRATIPCRFASAAEYLHVMERVVQQEIVLGLIEVATQFWEAARRFEQVGDVSNPFCNCKVKKAAVVHRVKKDGPNKGRMFYACSKSKKKSCGFFKWCSDAKSPPPPTGASDCTELTKEKYKMNKLTAHLASSLKENPTRLVMSFRSLGVSFYAKGTLNRCRDAKNPGKFSYFFECSSTGESESKASMGDLWILTRSMSFSSCCVMRATFHGFTAKGVMRLVPLPGSKPLRVPLNDSINIHALRALNCSSELDLLDNLNKMRESPPAILRSLADPSLPHKRPGPDGGGLSPFQLLMTNSQLVEIAETAKSEFTLNDDQSKILELVQSWFVPSEGGIGKNESSDVILCHGCFGAGKSYLMVALVHFIVRVVALENEIGSRCSRIRILIAASTNVAVDRVLGTLLESGYIDFERIGVSKKVDKPLRPYVAKSAPQTIVVGSTLASCMSNKSIKGQNFPICFIDECSQQVEPSTLLAMGFGCQKALLVGDPLQLPPVTRFASVAERYVATEPPQSKCGDHIDQPKGSEGINRAMFVRLRDSGSVTQMLRTQYRLHPMLSAIPNELFYEGQLNDGVTAQDREPLVPNLPTLLAYNCKKGNAEKSLSSHSYFNTLEANVVVKLLHRLKADGVEDSSVGVICLYKAQAMKIEEMMSGTRATSTVKPVAAKTISEEGNVQSRSPNGGGRKKPPRTTKHRKGQIKVSTVDAFQGAERDIIILSTVRSDVLKLDRESFISSRTRLCVALSRAKRHLIVVGDMNMLWQAPIWKRVSRIIRESGCIWSGDQFLKQEEKERAKINE